MLSAVPEGKWFEALIICALIVSMVGVVDCGVSREILEFQKR